MIRSLRLSLILLAFSLALTNTFVRPSAAQIVKLPIAVNSPLQSDLLPIVSADGRTLYFARTRMGLDGTEVFDIWSSTITNDTQYSAADVIGGALGSRFGIAVTSVSPDNNTLYLIGKLSDESQPDDRILVTTRTRTGWSIPQPIHIDDLNAHDVYTDFSFGPDQKTLLISVERDSSLGNRDLYVSFREKSGDWSRPQWLGPVVNSRFAEMTPYLAADNRTLYFSSDRPGGIGEVDVYRCVRLDNSWHSWSRPENLGNGINRPGRTTFYTEDASGTHAYFSWRQSESDQADIYRAAIHPTSAVALVHGRVLDNTGSPISARVYYNVASSATASSRDNALGSARSNPETGEYQIVLPAGQNYVMFADKEGYFVTTATADLTGLTSYQSIDRDLILTKADAGTHIALHNIQFETDKSQLLPESYTQLDEVVDFLRSYPNVRIAVRGHTDSTGLEAHNIELSRARAEAVRSYLVAKGIAAERITAEGKGSSEPISPNTTEQGRAMNRRVEFVIVKRD